MLKLVPVFVVGLCLIQTAFCYVSYQPEQIHLSYGDSLWEIVVTWSTMDDVLQPVVEYWNGEQIKREPGTTKVLTNDGAEKREQFIHKVHLRNLNPNSTYVYHCGSDLGWSGLFWFTTPPSDPSWSPRIALYGDMGNENAQSLPRLQEETQRGLYDVILHVGDFAYDLNDENGRVGDAFMNQIQSIAAYLPYMTCPGNHEAASNFSEYRHRFNMPGELGHSMFSFNMGPIHFISLSSEVYYYPDYGYDSVNTQFNWLVDDLNEATNPVNRSVRPWIVTFGHRPMYCSNDDITDCTKNNTKVRVGIPDLNLPGLERLFYDYGVDLEIWAHEHSYERLWPLYDYQVLNGSYEDPYRNPQAPVHIITGSAGNIELTDGFVKPPPPWSAFRSRDYGYTRLNSVNQTHLYLEQVSDDQGGEVIDRVWIIKDRHGPFKPMT